MLLRLMHILWAVALIATARMTFGSPVGELIAGPVLVVGLGRLKAFGLSHGKWAPIVFAALIAYSGVIFFMNPRIARERELRTACGDRLRQLARAVTLDERPGATLPQTHEPGLDGAGPQSWRVTILPRLDYQSLYETYRRDESWDGRHNIKLSQEMTYLHACPSDYTNDGTCCNYQAIVGEHTAWPPDRARPIREITDGLSRTIILIECASRGTPWSKPEDLTYDEAFELLTNPSPDAAPHYHESTNGFFYKSNAGPSLHVAFADGEVRLLDLPISKEAAKAILTVDGGESYDDVDLELVSSRELDYAACIGFPALILLACVPEWRLVRRNRLDFS